MSLINKEDLIAEYDRVHQGPPGGARKLMEDAPVVDRWIPVTERMPEEKDTMFAKFYGTEMWHEGMPRQWSNMVEVTVELENGTREVATSYTRDGKWEVENAQFAQLVPKKVVAWRPLPEPWKGEQE